MIPSPLPPLQRDDNLTSSTPRWMKLGLAGCAAAVTLVIGVIVLFLALVLALVKSNDAYTEARFRAVHDPRVAQLVGRPVQTGWWVMGRIRLDSITSANLDFPVHGPEGRATVHFVATRQGTKWHFTTLEVVKPAGEAIDLLQPPAR